MDTDSEAWERAGPPEVKVRRGRGRLWGGVIESAERLGKN
jgi:hypothetical protein